MEKMTGYRESPVSVIEMCVVSWVALAQPFYSHGNVTVAFFFCSSPGAMQ